MGTNSKGDKRNSSIISPLVKNLYLVLKTSDWDEIILYQNCEVIECSDKAQGITRQNKQGEVRIKKHRSFHEDDNAEEENAIIPKAEQNKCDFSPMHVIEESKNISDINNSELKDGIVIRLPERIPWQLHQNVVGSNQLQRMTEKQIKRQEVLYEILQTECTYAMDLEVLEDHFIKKIRESTFLRPISSDKIFSWLEPLIKSERHILPVLLDLFKKDIMLRGLSELIKKLYQDNTKSYIDYFRQTVTMNATYDQELSENKAFKKLMDDLQMDPITNRLPFRSFLLLPLHRLPKMPLLFKALIKETDSYSLECQDHIETLEVMEKLVHSCNEGIKKYNELLEIGRELKIPAHMELDLTNQYRVLCLRSSATRILNRDSRQRVELFLFNDLFLYARKHRSQQLMSIVDYCDRSDLHLVHRQHNPQMTLQFHLGCDFRKLVVILDDLSLFLEWTTQLIKYPLAATTKSSNC